MGKPILKAGYGEQRQIPLLRIYEMYDASFDNGQ